MSYDGEFKPRELTKWEKCNVKFNCPFELSFAIGSTFSWLPDAWADKYEWYVGWLWFHITLSNPAWWMKK
jgi:hypothetical protein